MRTIKSFIWMVIITFISMLSSCTEDTTISTSNSATVPVIYGTITDHNAQQEIDISSSTGYFDKSENKRISNAIVTIEEDTVGTSNLYTLTEYPNGSGVYKTNNSLAGKPGWTYKLTVSMDFDQNGTPETYTSECTMPKRVKLDAMSITKTKEAPYTMYSLNISAQDPANEKNYYFCKYSINNTLYNKISKYIIFDDTSLDGMYVKNLSIWNFFDKNDKSKFSDDDAANMIFLSGGENMSIEISNITKGYYQFIIDCQNQKDGSDPFFGGPPANISTNISNGAKGFFTAYSTSGATYLVPQDYD